MDRREPLGWPRRGLFTELIKNHGVRETEVHLLLKIAKLQAILFPGKEVRYILNEASLGLPRVEGTAEKKQIPAPLLHEPSTSTCGPTSETQSVALLCTHVLTLGIRCLETGQCDPANVVLAFSLKL